MMQTDSLFEGFLVGHCHDEKARTGCTVFLCPEGAVAGVDIRGQAPGTRETPSLDPLKSVSQIHGLLLSGGSAFGLDGAGGVMRFLEEKGWGLDVEGVIIPIVPAAVIFDLAWGDPSVRPTAEWGERACRDASARWPAEGMVGAGCGATVGKVRGIRYASTGGFGGAAIRLPGGAAVQAFAVVNSFGDIVNPKDGSIVTGTRAPDGSCADSSRLLVYEGTGGEWIPLNTTLVAVLTDAIVDKREAGKLAAAASVGMARTLRPCHSPYDGDTVFVLSTCRTAAALPCLEEAAACAVAEAILAAVRGSVPVETFEGAQ